MSGALDAIRSSVRGVMRKIAHGLDRLSGGKITPNMVTATSVLAHIPIAIAIARGYYIAAAIGLIVFGLMDALDGELARLQKKASPAGMVLDASTDRMKEAILYIGVAVAFVNTLTQDELAYGLAALVAAATGSIIVSYVKAKGETALTDSKLSANEKNRIFQDGLMRYEVRMFALVVGLLSNALLWVIIFIAVLAWYTALRRLQLIYGKLNV